MCLVRYLNPVNKNLAKIRNIDKEFEKHLDSKGIEVPVYKKVYTEIDKQNALIYVFGYEDETPYLNWITNFSKTCWNSKNSHFASVKNFKMFMTNKTKHHGKKIFTSIAYNAFLAQKY